MTGPPPFPSGPTAPATPVAVVSAGKDRGTSDREGTLTASEGKQFDLLISDIGLPDGSGMDVMRHMRRDTRVRGSP